MPIPALFPQRPTGQLSRLKGIQFMVSNRSFAIGVLLLLVSLGHAKIKEKQPGILIRKGAMTDPRDGKVYKTVRIGPQVWMAENLNYELANSWCYDDKPQNCATYGRLYDWQTAKMACPVGWRLASNKDWATLEYTVDNEALGLMSQEMKGNDKYGFGVKPAGFRNPQGFYIRSEDCIDCVGFAAFWTSTELHHRLSWERFFGGIHIVHIISDQTEKEYGYSVRCLRN
jgi:uncharacterized protein (TIGR02145 family)